MRSMTPDELELLKSGIYRALLLFGGVQVVLVGLAAFLGKIQINRLLQKDIAQRERLIRELRSRLERENAVLNTALATLNVNNEAAQGRRIEAVTVLWKTILDVRSRFGLVTYFYDVIVLTEKDRAPHDPAVDQYLRELADPTCRLATNITLKMAEVWRPVEEQRPFLGEVLWQWFYTYRMVMGRLNGNLAESYETGRVVPWTDDGALMAVFKEVVGADPDASKNVLERGPLGWLFSCMETRIAQEMHHLLAGRVAAEQSISQASRLAEITQRTTNTEQAAAEHAAAQDGEFADASSPPMS